ncbi:hypothetical protein BASA81_003225 [Batrachochytrium salamandrivorans]|nr:hypothetical protein BASA81_003225 [Batrachochytrium salamandrivorans]
MFSKIIPSSLSPKSLKRRLSSNSSSCGGGGSNTLPEMEIAQIQLLEELIRDTQGGRELVNCLLCLDESSGEELQLQVRFVAYVLQFEQTTDSRDKKAKGQAIVDMFLLRHSRCRLCDAVIGNQRDVSVQQLPAIKLLVLQRLIASSKVCDLL